MPFRLGKRSKKRLHGVHKDLVKVVKRAIEITECDFAVIDGLRTLKKQKELFASGASKTMRSRHLTGHAVDLGAYVDGKINWDWCYYHKIHAAVEQAAFELEVDVEWGGNWKSFKDGPHFQLPWNQYPAKECL